MDAFNCFCGQVYLGIHAKHLWLLISYWFHLECPKFLKYTLCNVNPEPFMLQLSRLCSQNVGLVYEKRHWYMYILQMRRNTVSRNPALPLLVHFNGLNYHMRTQQGLPYLLIDMTFVIVVTSENMSVVKVSKAHLPACVSQDIFLTITLIFL